MEPNRFKAWLKAPLRAPAAEDADPAATSTPPLGAWLMSGAPSTAEALGFCGFDFLVVDLEHVPIDVAEAIGLLRTLAGTPAEALVRLSWNDQVQVKRVLDAGARSLMFPFIETAEEARKAVSFTRYPPLGVRGMAGVHRASRFGRAPNYFQNADAQVSVTVQLETPGAVDRAGEIAAVEGVDSLFLGPGDLSAAMGRIGRIDHPEVQAVIRRAAAAAHAAGKPIGIVGPTPAMVRRFIDYGYDWVAMGSDMAFMTGRAVEWIDALRGGVSVAGASAY